MALLENGDSSVLSPERKVASENLPGRCLHEIFAARVDQMPHQAAVSMGASQLSYRELDRRANKLAHRLMELGVAPDVLVGLCLERGVDLIVAVLGILKAGGAYVPIDPAYPGERMHLMVEDSAVSVVVTASSIAPSFPKSAATLLCLDDSASEISSKPDTRPAPRANPQNLAYVIYTSGSTGTPKGVMIEHHNVVRLFEQTQGWFNFGPWDVWTMFHSIGFDFSVWEIWGALLNGGEVVVVPFEIARSPSQFYDLLRHRGVTVLNQTPSAFRQLIAEDGQRAQSDELALRLVIFGGEALDLGSLRPWFERHGDCSPMLVNMYGITETTVHVTYRPLTKADTQNAQLSPIGVPIPDLEIHVLDDRQQPVPEGTEGDIWVGGAGVARGYLNRPDLTAERFRVLDLAGISKRLYWSGDRTARLPDGDLNYLGRSDDQIKVRGYRIEPREVELCLSGLPQVATVTVVRRDYGDGDVRLVAAVVPCGMSEITEILKEQLTGSLSNHAATRLPAYMRPSAYAFVMALPITPHGKVDKAAIRQLFAEEKPAGRTPVQLGVASVEDAVREIWEEVLEVKGIGPMDDFFDLGGTSYSLVRMFARITKRFDVSIELSTLVEGATIASLTSAIEKERVQAGNGT